MSLDELNDGKISRPPQRQIKKILRSDRVVSEDVFLSANTRILELESLVANLEINNNHQGLVGRIERLEKDVQTYRQAREAANFVATDLRAALDRSSASIEALRASPPYRLGSLLLAAGRNWRELLRLPATLIRWSGDSRRYRDGLETQIVQAGSATEYNEAVERTLELADKRGHYEAERWAIDQRFRAQVLARVLTELASHIRRSDPQEAVRLAEAALDADPNENRVKRLAFLMAEAGSVTHASKVLRSAMEHGATFNATEEARAEDLFALADLASSGLTLIPKRRWQPPVGSVGRRVLIFSPQAYPYHWSSASIRTHALALSLAETGIPVDVITPPGYPDLGSRQRVERASMRQIDGIDYHLLPHTAVDPGFGIDYMRQASSLLISTIRKLMASILIAPADFMHAYPAAVASHITGASLMLDCWSVPPDEGRRRTERSQILSGAEERLFQHARTAIARTPAIAARLAAVSGATDVHLAYESTPGQDESLATEPRADDGRFVFGYVGDNTPDVDIESLTDMLEALVREGVDARLVIYSVGARVQALREQLELAGLGERISIERPPPNRRPALAYRDLDIVVVPLRPTEEGPIRSPFHIAAALRHGKCVIAVGADEHKDTFGAALVHADGSPSAVQALLAFAGDVEHRRRQEAEARLWNKANPSHTVLLNAVESL